MKTLFAILILASTILNIHAQNLIESDVPAAVKEKFSSLYPAIKAVKWEKEHNEYEAEFRENNIETSVIFAENGAYIQTETEISISSLPAGITDYAVKNFPEKNIKDASKITDAFGKISYEAEIGGRDYLFDENGKFIKISEDSNDNDNDDK